MQRLFDNKQKGYIDEYLKENIGKNSKISIASAYFTSYAFNELKNELSKIDSLRFLFNEPTFIKSEKIKERYKQIDGLQKEIKQLKVIYNFEKNKAKQMELYMAMKKNDNQIKQLIKEIEV